MLYVSFMTPKLETSIDSCLHQCCILIVWAVNTYAKVLSFVEMIYCLPHYSIYGVMAHLWWILIIWAVNSYANALKFYKDDVLSPTLYIVHYVFMVMAHLR